MGWWDAIGEEIARATGEPFTVTGHQPLGGGDINDAYRLEGDGRVYFVKTNAPSRDAMFEAEALGLREMAEADAVRVPEPVCWGTTDAAAYIVLEYIPLGGRADMAAFGERLAAMHAKEWERFGWHRDNTIGSTPQLNAPHDDWAAFYRDQRLGYQLELAGRHGFRGELQRKGERLMGELEHFFSDYRPVPSLLHGDLWGGNYAGDEHGDPVIFDPAVYYGDREADLAMTELFGGFGGAFYDAYHNAWPIDPGYKVRKSLYNLYHILNHLNLFGAGYRGQAERMIDRLLAEVR